MIKMPIHAAQKDTYLSMIPLWKWLLLFLISFLFFFLVYQVSHYLITYEFSSGPFKIISYALTSSLILLCYKWLSGAYEQRYVYELNFSKVPSELSKGIFYGVALILTTTLLLLIICSCKVRCVQINVLTLIVPLSRYLLVATGEEMIFRGIVYRMVEERWGTVIAIIFSCLLFGFSHLLNDNSSIWSSAAIALSTIVLCAAYFSSKTLWFPIGLHWMWNFVQGNIFGFHVSGGDIQPSILSVNLDGSDLLTGGRFGPEASIITVIVCVLTAVFLMYRGLAKGHFVPTYFYDLNS